MGQEKLDFLMWYIYCLWDFNMLKDPLQIIYLFYIILKTHELHQKGFYIILLKDELHQKGNAWQTVLARHMSVTSKIRLVLDFKNLFNFLEEMIR